MHTHQQRRVESVLGEVHYNVATKRFEARAATMPHLTGSKVYGPARWKKHSSLADLLWPWRERPRYAAAASGGVLGLDTVKARRYSNVHARGPPLAH